MVKCRECQKEMRMINNTHLRMHGMTPDDYLEKYPDSTLYDETMLIHIKNTRLNAAPLPMCANPFFEPHPVKNPYNRFCSKSHALNYRLRREGGGQGAKYGSANIDNFNKERKQNND